MLLLIDFSQKDLLYSEVQDASLDTKDYKKYAALNPQFIHRIQRI